MVNELMTCCMHHQQNSTQDAIKCAVRDFYTPEEIHEAKVALWDACGTEVLGSTQKPTRGGA